MRKQTKLALGLSAAALLAVGASMTSFAARGWVAEGDQWYYYDNSGDYVTDKWKSYNGNYFYLGSDGYMLTNELIEDGNNWYYVDANGAMVKNTWVAVPVDDSDEDLDVDYRWYYFGANGKAYKDAAKKTINGKKYGFDEEGKMLFGFVGEDETSLLTDVDDAVLQCLRYYGNNDDGAMYSGWLLYQDALDAEGYDDQYYWFYFKSNGKKVSGKTEKVKGKTYNFDNNGVMIYGWADNATVGGSVTAAFFSNEDDGSLQKGRWVWNDGTYGLDSEDKVIGDGDDHWYYVKKNGQAYYDQTKKINGKWYVFDEKGIMKWGLVYLETASVKADGAKIAGYPGTSDGDAWDPENVSSEDIYNGDYNLFYFSSDEEKDGSMKTGTSIKIELQDDTKTFGFDKNTGRAMNGKQKNNKVYNHGILQTVDDYKYAPVTVMEDGVEKTYLCSSSGTAMKPSKTRTYKDSEDMYYGVNSDWTPTGRYETAKEAKAAIDAE